MYLNEEQERKRESQRYEMKKQEQAYALQRRQVEALESIASSLRVRVMEP